MNSSNPFSAPTADVADIMSSGARQVPQLYSARGRIGRLRLVVYTGVASIIFGLILGLGAAIVFGLGMASGVLGILAIVGLGLAFYVFYIFKLVQRSHDMGWSGWTVILALFIPLVNLIWLFKPGTPGDNEYGAPPIPNSTGIKIGAWIFGALMVLSVLISFVGGLAGGR